MTSFRTTLQTQRFDVDLNKIQIEVPQIDMPPLDPGPPDLGQPK